MAWKTFQFNSAGAQYWQTSNEFTKNLTRYVETHLKEEKKSFYLVGDPDEAIPWLSRGKHDPLKKKRNYRKFIFNGFRH